ncbi:MAG: lysophospholipid acyltransferase family protein [Geminicoccales bacterium]
MSGAHNPVLASLRALAFVVLTGTLLIPALLARLTAGRVPPWLKRAWHRGCCAIFGLEIHIHGAPATGGATLYVANHVSYLDISVLGAVLNVPFVAKAEVARWPLFGLIGKLGETMFIDRAAARSAGQRDVLAARLGAGERLILFAEGTSSSGGRVLPFKSALFGALERAAADRPVRVQPVTIAYTRFRGGLTIVHAFRPLYAWYGDMTLLPHIWTALGLPGAEVEVRFHAPVLASDFASRKALARHAEQAVASGLAAARAA